MSFRERPAPPALARLLIRLTLPADHRAACLSDLEERHRLRVSRAGAAAARRWYWRQAAGFVARVPLERIRRPHDHSTRRHADTFPSPTAGSGSASRGVRSGQAGRSMIAACTRDLVFAARTLRMRPGFTIPAMVILALAIGANAAVLSIVDNVLLRDLPVDDADSIVLIWDLVPPGERRDRRLPVSYDTYRAWAERGDLFASVVALDTEFATLEADDFTIRAEGAIVSGNMFDLLGARPARGRTLSPADDAPDAGSVVVISDRLWRSHFAADPDVVGRVISMDAVPTTVVGVMPSDFWFFDPYGFVRAGPDRDTEQPDYWQPLGARNWDNYGDSRVLRVMARLRDGVARQRAFDALAATRAALAEQEARQDIEVGMTTLTDEVLGEKRNRLLLLQGAVTLLILIACVNLMSLVLAKAAAHRGELAVRAALGAGRGSLLRLAISEALLLGIGGGILGLLAARSMGGVILSIAPRDLPLAHRVAIDGRIALITMGAAIAASIVAGALPAFRLDLASLTRALSGGSRSVAGDAAASRTRFFLVAFEVALTLVLLIGATIMLRSFVGSWRTDPGFDRESALTYFVTLSTLPGEEPDYGFHDRLLRAVRGLPGVEDAGGTTHLPFTNWGMSWPIAIGEGETMEDAPRVDGRWVTETYLPAMGIELRAGRGFSATDGVGSEPVILVNEAFVDRFFVATADLTDIVGTMIRVGKYGPPRLVPHRVVGVVENVKTGRLFEAPRPLVYQASRQQPTVYLRHVVRTAGNPASLAEPIRLLAADIDRGQPIAEIYPLSSLVADSLAEERFYAQLLSAFGLLAFALAAIGIYGSVAYSTRLRLREFGIRIAFGAPPREVRRLIVGRGLAPVLLGIVAGCAGAALLARGLEALLHGVSPIDPVSFLAGCGVFLVVAAIAAFIPAQRAAAVDPIRVLRAD